MSDENEQNTNDQTTSTENGSGDNSTNNKKGGLSDEKYEGMIKLVVSNISAFSVTSSSKTPEQFIAMLPWLVEVKRFNSTDDKIDYLSINVYCNSTSESNLWACDASVDLRLLSARVGVHGTTSRDYNFKATYNYNKCQFGAAKFIAWDVLSSTDLGYIKNDELTIEAHITIKNIVGVYNNTPIDFLTEQRDHSDVILNVEGNQLHLNKSYLGMYSRFFNAMFFSGFNESTKDEIVLKEVKFDHFTDLLKVIYPTRKRIDAHNVDYLLKLGDQYDVRFVVQECEAFLINTDEITVAKKLLYADQYYLSKLQENCLKTLQSSSSIKSLKTTLEYREMSDASKTALLEKMFKLI